MVSRSDRAVEERAAERRPAMAPSTLRARDRQAADVTVVDLSQTGIRIAAEAGLEVGEEISIGLAGVGARRAYVAWAREGQYGCAFEKPLAPTEVAHAFTSASVVRLGHVAEAAEAPAPKGKAELEELYGRHSLWRMPADAVLAIVGCVALLGWGVWRFALAG